MGEILLYFIGLFLWMLIGGAAAFKRPMLFCFAIVIGFWFAVLLFVIAPVWCAIVYFLIYWIVVVGSIWRDIEEDEF